jgi:hypothetical protein
MKPDLRQQLNDIIASFFPAMFLLGITFALASYVFAKLAAPEWLERLEKNNPSEIAKP